MRLLVIRHGVAEDRDDFAATGEDDDARPLTLEGRKKMRRVARGLVRVAACPDILASSPLTRAEQTAAIVAAAFGIPVGAQVDALRPDSTFAAFIRWASRHPEDSLVAIVGHEPHLSELVCWLMTGERKSRLTLKKGGACMLSFDGKPKRDRGCLEWLSTPAQLAI